MEKHMRTWRGLPVKLESPELYSIPYQTNEDNVTRQNSPLHFIDESVVFDNTSNYNSNPNVNLHSNARIKDWFQGCQVLGFIPDHSSGSVNIPVQNYCTYQGYYKVSNDYENKQAYAGNVYQCCSTKPKQNNLKVNLKRKRKRTIFTREQVVALEELFQRKSYISRDERIAMMNKLQVTEKSIKIWFQNRRRMADKKEYTSDSPSSMDTPDSFSERLNFIESQINENTDENGNVSLSDDVMSELARIIDEYLSQDVNQQNRDTVLDSTNVKNIVMYEPISPASSEDVDD